MIVSWPVVHIAIHVLLATMVVVASMLLYIIKWMPTKQQNRLGFFVGSIFLRISMCFLNRTLFTIDYFGGFMMHFETTAEELRKHIPNQDLEPIPMKILATDTESKFLVSLYTAHLDIGNTNLADGGGRTDVFSYVRDKDGEVGLVFLCALQDYPAQNPIVKWILKSLNHFFGMCPVDYTTGYPHYETKVVKITDDSLYMEHDKGCKIHVAGNEAKLCTDLRMHLDFINANSQIYRGSKGVRNVNFFNKDFIDASVTEWDVKQCTAENPSLIHPLCKKLLGIQSYNGRVGAIRWYFENA